MRVAVSLKANIMALPSDEMVEVETTLPFFLSVSSVPWSFTTLIATVSW
jgi:hypothetical protein